MSEFEQTSETEEPVRRCPHCDSVVTAVATQCIMCGGMLTPVASEPEPETVVPPSLSEEPIVETPVSPPLTEPIVEPTTPTQSPQPKLELPQAFVSVMRERQSRSVLLLTAVFTIFILILSVLILRYQGPITTFAFVPTATAVPPTPSYTPTLTPVPTETPIATETPTITPSPAPSATPQPERLHILSAGETLFGLAVIYNVSVESIAQVNELNPDGQVQAGQSLSIPWPTVTPPLEAVAVDINGETVIALPDGCPRHEIQAGESIASIANQYGIDFDLLLRVNRLTVDTIVQPGQTVCIPEIRFGGDLPPTPGPSPTPAPTRFPAGPQLLYPVNNTVVDADGVVTLQWTAVKDLNDNEWYMIELTDINVLDVPPYRGFTRDNSFQIPGAWRPDVPEEHSFRWRISIVQVTDWRADGQPIYEYGGRFSQDAFFSWLGAIPTATPTQTPAPSPTVTPEA